MSKKKSGIACPMCNRPMKVKRRRAAKAAGSGPGQVVKSAAQERQDMFMAKIRASSDPTEREALWYSAHPEFPAPWGTS